MAIPVSAITGATKGIEQVLDGMAEGKNLRTLDLQPLHFQRAGSVFRRYNIFVAALQ